MHGSYIRAVARLQVRQGFTAPGADAPLKDVAGALRDGLRSAEAVEVETGIAAERVHLLAQGFASATAREEQRLRTLAAFAESLADEEPSGEWGDLVARLVSDDVADGHDVIDNL